MIDHAQLLSAKSPALLFSGGSDSLLLLKQMWGVRRDFVLIHFFDQLHPEVEDLIKDWDLEVLSWKPAARYLIPFDGDIALVSEYSFGNARLPVLRDIVDGDDCQLERLNPKRTEFFDYPFLETYWGYRRSDELHPIMPQHFPQTFPLGPTQFVAPLYYLTDKEVSHQVARQKHKPVTNDAITMCVNCKAELSTWNREASLNYFSNRFGYAKAA